MALTGKLIIVSAPSGSGKTTIVQHLLSSNLNLEFSVSACSREKREGEVEGRDYYFLSPEKFRERIAKDEFIEWEEVYEGQFYGTLRSEIDRIRAKGKHVIFDVDVVGGLNLKEKFPDESVALFVMPPSIGELKNRLEKRSADSRDSICKRVEKAKEEMSFADRFDVIIINDDLQTALDEAVSVVRKFIES